MIGAKSLLADRERTPVNGFGVLIAALLVIDKAEVAQHDRDIGMIRTEDAFHDRQ